MQFQQNEQKFLMGTTRRGFILIYFLHTYFRLGTTLSYYGKSFPTLQYPIIKIQKKVKEKNYMRIFVTAPDETGTPRKTRMTLVDCNTTTQLLKRISVLCNIQYYWLIVKLRTDLFHIRIVDGWALDVYPIRQGSELVVEILPGGIKQDSPLLSPSKLGQIDEENQLEMEDNSTTGLPDQKMSFFSDSNSMQYDWTKYFEQSLEQFLDSVRKQSIQEANNILKSQPECNDEKVLSRIMNKKINFLLNQTGECGRTALHWAIQDKNLDMVEFLLIKSADPNVVSVDQYTPLQLSIVLRASSIFQTLVSHPKIDLNKVTKKGTALHVCVENQLVDYAQKLLTNGANPEVENVSGESFNQLCQRLGVKGLKIKKKQQQATDLPFILRGNLSRVSSFASRLKQRLLLVNPFTNQFILFEQKVPEHNIPIKEIDTVKQIKEKSWGMKKQYFYFQVNSLDLELVFCVKHQMVGKRWIQSLRKCVHYCKGLKQKSNVPITDQLIEVFDDVQNTVKVHKHKLAQPPVKKVNQNPRSSKKLNLLDLKPIDQSAPIKTEPTPNKILQSKQFSEIMGDSTIYPVTLSQQFQPDYLRESSLLGSVINQQSILKSVFLGKSADLRQSAFQDKIRPMVCYKDFDILRQLGNGSFGRVFLARYRRNQKLYALKVLNKKKLIAKKQLKYAVGQANILKKVDSPFIIKLHYSFQTPTNLYIAIDYCPNGDLTQLMSDQQRLSQRVCKFYTAQLILAVQYLHKNKIIYRDLKPENILLGEDGFIRLTDFNLSKENNFSMSFCGSPAYLSPEMLEKKGVGFQADIYGIGCVFYEMLVGQPPFFDDNLDKLYENIRTGKLKFPSWISKPARSLISGLLERNVSKRIGAKNMQQIKTHEFFYGFDWQQLQKLQMKLPLELESKIIDKSQVLQVIQDHGFQDSDYESNSSMINRIKNFTFVREIEESGPIKQV